MSKPRKPTQSEAPAPKRGRPRGERTAKLHVRHTPTQREAWELAAEVEGRTVSDWLRIVADRAAAETLDRVRRGRGERGS